MAYDPKQLSVLAYANGFTLWHYSTCDLLHEVTDIGYFNKASDMLRTDDRIMVGAYDAAADVTVYRCEGDIRIAVLSSVLRVR